MVHNNWAHNRFPGRVWRASVAASFAAGSKSSPTILASYPSNNKHRTCVGRSFTIDIRVTQSLEVFAAGHTCMPRSSMSHVCDMDLHIICVKSDPGSPRPFGWYGLPPSTPCGPIRLQALGLASPHFPSGMWGLCGPIHLQVGA